MSTLSRRAQRRRTSRISFTGAFDRTARSASSAERYELLASAARTHGAIR